MFVLLSWAEIMEIHLFALLICVLKKEWKKKLQESLITTKSRVKLKIEDKTYPP